MGRKLFDQLKIASDDSVLAFAAVPNEMELHANFKDDFISMSQVVQLDPNVIYMEGGLFFRFDESWRWRIEQDALMSRVRDGAVVVVADIDRNILSEQKVEYKEAGAFLDAWAVYDSPKHFVEDGIYPVYGVDEESCWKSSSNIVCQTRNMLVSDWLRPIYADIAEILAISPCLLNSNEFVASGNEYTTGTLLLDRWVDKPHWCHFAVLKRHGFGYVVTIAAQVSADMALERCPDNTRWLVRLITFLREEAMADKARRMRQAP